MPITELDFLKQMATLQQSCADLARRFVVDNQGSTYEDFAEEQFEDCSGDAALLKLWIDVYGVPEPSASNSSAVAVADPAARKAVYLKPPQT